MTQNPTVIVAARRTPIGSFQGALSPVSAVQLSAAANRAAIADSGIGAEQLSEVLLGCVLPAGLGQAPARQAAIASGIPMPIGCTTVNKVCGSGMKTVLLGSDMIQAGSADIVLAGGMESMSNAPYLLPKARAGFRMGHQQTLDHMFYDGLQDPYDGHMMGHYAEKTVEKYGFTREQQDEFSIASVTRANTAINDGLFATEIAPVTVKSRKGETICDTDEEPGRSDIERIPQMRASFAKDGSVTAASSSSISDGAAAVILMSEQRANELGVNALARIVGSTGFAQEPAWFTTSPVFALRQLHEKLGWSPENVDLYEVNEAFACVTMAAMRDVGIEHEQMNVHGGACALGHPIGATGARLIVTLIHALQARSAKRGVASLCIGGGEALAIGIERL